MSLDYVKWKRNDVLLVLIVYHVVCGVECKFIFTLLISLEIGMIIFLNQWFPKVGSRPKFGSRAHSRGSRRHRGKLCKT